MAEELSNQFTQMFRTIYEAVDLEHLRPLKRQMFKCGHDCLDDRNSVREAERCVDECGKSLHKAMNLVQTEVNSFQGRIDRCLMECQDSVRKEKDEAKARRMFESCADSCVKKFTVIVPEVIKTIKENLANSAN